MAAPIHDYPFLTISKVDSSAVHGARTADSVRDGLIAKQPPSHRGGVAPRALARVHEFVEAHLEENISIHVLAAVAGLSTYHFARAFKRSEGMTPHDYVVQCRIRRTQELLASTDLPVSEIAGVVGFADQSHCTRRFREHVGVTPCRYRWLMR
jgi:AraC family transcriptional regulator